MVYSLLGSATETSQVGSSVVPCLPGGLWPAARWLPWRRPLPPPDAARRMSRALEEEAGAWEWRRAEERRRADVARVLRAAVVSTVYAASGGSLMAPVLASLGVLGARAEEVKRE